MNSEWIFPDSWQVLVIALCSVLHQRSAWRLAVLIAGIIFAKGRRTVTSWFRCAGKGSRYQQGKIDQAIQTYQNGLKSLPDNWDFHYNLGLILNAQRRTDEAVKQLRSALKIDPNDIRARRELDSIENNR